MEHKIKGTVIHGNHIGSELGFPTANIQLGPEDNTEDGVYAAEVIVDGIKYYAMANVGRRPSVHGTKGRFLEANLFGFSGDLYRKEIEVNLVSRIRDERKFDSLEILREQIVNDREDIIKYFNI